MSQDEIVITKLNKLLKSTEDFVLATVINTWNSAPKPIGSMLIINNFGEIFGSVSGGCVEGAVITEAMTALKTKESKILTFGVSNSDAFQVGLACGGEIKILLEPILQSDKNTREKIGVFIEEYFNNNLVIYCINLISFKRSIIKNVEVALSGIPMDRLSERKSFILDDTFLSILYPKLKLVIVGAVHIAQYLVELANMFEYQIFVVDPRSTFASKTRFPTARIFSEWPDVAIGEIKLDENSALVTLTHDSKIDDIALEKAMNSNCFYIGSLGSKRTHTKRIDRFKLMGFKKEQLDRIKGPVGLNIGAKTPNEIALSIMAEIVSLQKSSKTLIKQLT